MSGEALKGHLDMLLLAALRDDAAHGYAIAERLRELSGGTFDLPEGTVYPALHRLEQAGLLGSQWIDARGRRRRVYHLTSQGQRRLVERQAEWSRFAEGVGGVLRGWQRKRPA